MLISQIPYAPASALVAEVVELQKANAPKSVIEVLLCLLEERKEELEKAGFNPCFEGYYMLCTFKS